MKRAALDPARILGLLERVTAGDKRAFTEFYDETSPLIYGVLLRLLRNPESAMEAMQDCYIRVWRRSETYAVDKGDPCGWLIGIARYRALDLIRTQQQRRARLDANASDIRDATVVPMSPEMEALVSADIDRMQTCLDTLPDTQRRSLLLAYYEGYSHQELAEQMAVPLGTAKAWVRRGLARLRSCLEQA